MVVLIVIVALYHNVLNSAYAPLIAYLPISLAPKIEKIQGYAFADRPYASSGVEGSGSAEALEHGKGGSLFSAPSLPFSLCKVLSLKDGGFSICLLRTIGADIE
jgi:hypothetical protein